MMVTSTGRTSGRKTGKISPALSLLKLPGRQSFTASFTVDGGMGQPGDSGAWVYSEERRELCGHILAWSDALNVAYIAPMEVLFENIKSRLGAREVRLPAEVPFAHPSLVDGARQSASLAENKKNAPVSTTALTNKIADLHINTSSTATLSQERERARTISRSSSHREEGSPKSAASARRSRADTVPRTQSPTQIPVQLPTPPADAKCARRDVYEYKLASDAPTKRRSGPPIAGIVPS